MTLPWLVIAEHSLLRGDAASMKGVGRSDRANRNLNLWRFPATAGGIRHTLEMEALRGLAFISLACASGSCDCTLKN